MIKYVYSLSLILVLSIFGFATGCDLDSSSSSDRSTDNSDSQSLIELNCKVQTKTPVPLRPGDIGYYDCGQYRIIVTELTTIVHTRESCSGSEAGGFNDVKQGDTIFVSYRKDDADWSKNPAHIRATRIEAYGKECISGGYIENDGCGGCPDPFFD